MATPSILLPGDTIHPSRLPLKQNTTKTLTLGPGIAYTPPSSFHTTTTGTLHTDSRKHVLWLENASSDSRYTPTPGDLVIASVHHTSVDVFHCALSPHTPHATLPQLAFEGATKKTRPMLQPGSVVYARVSGAEKHMDPEIECVHPSTGKSEGLGELKGGMIFDISLGMARRLMMVKTKEEGRVTVLEEAAEKHGARFEIAVGRNGRIWIRAESIKVTVALGRALKEADEKQLTVEEQVKLVKAMMKGTN
jgi:exosome complex component RRP40